MPLDYLPRSAWNARASLGPKNLPATNLHGTALHYPAMGATTLRDQAAVAAALRGWQDYHMDTRGWSDIAYQVAVDQAGRKWQLRGLTTESAANGNQAANLAYGAILLVLGDTEPPSAAMINATRDVIADFRRLYPNATEIQPHSAVRLRYTGSGTDCPGDPTRSLISAGAFKPQTVTPTPEGSEMNDADRTYVDKRIQAYSLWLNLRRLSDDLAIATARKDAIAVAVLTPLFQSADHDWRAAAAK